MDTCKQLTPADLQRESVAIFTEIENGKLEELKSYRRSSNYSENRTFLGNKLQKLKPFSKWSQEDSGILWTG